MLKRIRTMDRSVAAMLVAAAIAVAGPFGLAVGYHSGPIGHHTHPTPVPYLYVDSYPDEYQVGVGEPNGFTISVFNYGSAAGTVTEVVNTLPLGFRYMPGSTSGAILDDPIVEGRKLRWRVRKTIDQWRSMRFHFDVQVAQRPGRYRNFTDVRAKQPAIVDGSGASIVYVGVPTELEATAAILKGEQLRLKFTGRLTTQGAPLAGQLVSFSTGSGVAGLASCSAFTNARGVAECTGVLPLTSAVASLGYDASFEPWEGIYGPSWDHGDLVE